MVALLVSLISCKRDERPRCVVGASVACVCVGGSTGAQVCKDDGTLGQCVCGQPAAAMPTEPDKPAVPVAPEAQSATADPVRTPEPARRVNAGSARADVPPQANVPVALADAAIGTAATAPRTGHVTVDASPPCVVSIDHVERGTSPVTVDLSPGLHLFRCVRGELSEFRAERIVGGAANSIGFGVN